MRILLVNSQARTRSALRMLLEQDADLSVVAEATTTERISDLIQDTQPNLMLVDWSNSDSELSRLLQSSKQEHPEMAIMVLSSRPEVRRLALRSGADAYVSKFDPPDLLLRALRAIQIGGGF